MNIRFVPRYGREAASSRLRVYAIADEIARQGLAETSVARENIMPVAGEDLSVLQKINLHGAPLATSRKMVFDYDDWLPALLGPAATCCRLITFDTEGRKSASLPIQVPQPTGPLALHRPYLEWITRFPKATVIPDCIDYGLEKPWPAADGDELALAWFGNYGNFNCGWMFRAWDGPKAIISDRLDTTMVGWTFYAWDYISLPRFLRQCGVCALSHQGGDPHKSNNKLIAAVTMGVPCIVGKGSPEYEALLTECDLGAFIVRNGADVRDCMRELASFAGRQAYLEKIQPLVWERYRVEVVARQAFELYKGIIDGD